MDSDRAKRDLLKSIRTAQTPWLTKNNLIRPGVYLPREEWERFEQALAIENYLRAQDGLTPVSRTNIISEFIRKWSAKKLQDTL